ncbi:hypothetical protein GTQ40_14115 [Flavobacteriaceae bacterium R38]|nr:hypothetical protein [Flavobacteriaceae bacterium R38]
MKNLLKFGKILSKKEQKEINGGVLLPVSDCCVCIYRPAGLPYQIILTQSCSITCPVDGDPEQYGDGC